MKNTFYLFLICLLLSSCASKKYYKNYVGFQSKAIWDCLYLEVLPAYEASQKEKFDHPFYTKIFHIMDSLRQMDTADVGIFTYDYGIGGSSVLHYFWVKDNQGYLTNLACARYFNIKNCTSFKILKLKPKETQKILKYCNSLRTENVSYYYSMNCSECVNDGGGEELFIWDKKALTFYIKTENCSDAEAHILGIETYETRNKLFALMDSIWKKYYSEDLD